MIKALWTATAAIWSGYRDAIRLVLLTAQRPGECCGIRREEVDLAKAIWTLPPERVKNGRPHAIPVVGEALEIVTRLCKATSSGALIKAPKGEAPTAQDLAQAVKRIRNVFAEKVTPHDLRRTAVTIMERLEIDRLTVAHVVNHTSTTRATITGSTYSQHDFLPQKRRALEALDAQVKAILGGTDMSCNVVALGRGRK